MPRAATSVATSTGRVPSLKAASIRARAPWVRPPCRDPAITPASRNWAATRSVPNWVRAKMTVRPSRLAMRAVTSTLSWGFTRKTSWRMVVTLALPESTSCRAGSFMYFLTSRSTAPSRVAEKSSFWPPSETASSSVVTAGMKPRSAMWSASSSTVICTLDRSAAPCSSRSIRRPGVATTMSTPLSKALVWGP
ncbi:Uncharacterised protein [Mycobacteroides abscessus subsp. abscessus]|nr:Uncharacterised protein [Mycobacteroides abscessus subsp. abscessus]